MSKATKKKHVTTEVLNSYVLPELNQRIARVISGKGNNLHEVQTPDGSTFLVSMPTKFRRNVWIKRGDYVIVEPIEEGDKVKAEIFSILFKDQIKYIKAEGKWPQEFEDGKVSVRDESYLPDVTSDDDGDNNSLICNVNRQPYDLQMSDSDTSSDED